MKKNLTNRIKKRNKPIIALTAYDAPTARILEEKNIDIILVGDSVSTVMLGYSDTTYVTVDEMIHHIKAVRRGAPRSFIVGDLPWKAVSRGKRYALSSARRFINAGCDAVKLEWKQDAPRLAKLFITNNIPVMGHIGLTPQTAMRSGGLRARGRVLKEALDLYFQAKSFEKNGAFSVVMECMPDVLAQKITKDIKIPTIGIGSGPKCDGQVLVFQDVVGLVPNFRPRFLKRFSNCHEHHVKALDRFIHEVSVRRFPSKRNSYSMDKVEYKAFIDKVSRG